MEVMKKIVTGEQLIPLFDIPSSLRKSKIEVTIRPVDLSCALLSESSLAKDWLSEEEENAWKDL